MYTVNTVLGLTAEFLYIVQSFLTKEIGTIDFVYLFKNVLNVITTP